MVSGRVLEGSAADESRDARCEVKIGLVGFPGSGKTTLFNSLTGMDVPVGFGGELRVGAVKVPDPRVDWLSKVYEPKKTTYAEVVFCDVPGEHGAGRQGLSKKALQQVRSQDALCLVLRDFQNPSIEGEPDPAADLYSFTSECILADLELVERRIERMKKEKHDKRELDQFEAVKRELESETPLRLLGDDSIDRGLLRGYSFLTEKPLMVVVNRSEEDAAAGMPEALNELVSSMGAEGLALSASVEAEIARLDPGDQEEFLSDLGMKEPVLNRFVQAAYRLLDLISFFTVGDDEVRAWTIRRGTKAKQAAGRIHSDLERGFIRAEITPYEVFERYGSESAVKEAGELRVEGAGRVIEDGEIVHVRFNV